MATINTISTINSSGVIKDVPAEFDIERDLIHPASEVVGNLRDAIEAIGDRADTTKASAEVDRLRDLLDHADIVAVEASTTSSRTLDALSHRIESIAAQLAGTEATLRIFRDLEDCPANIGEALHLLAVSARRMNDELCEIAGQMTEGETA